MRITVLSETTLRIESVRFDDRASFSIVNRRLSRTPPYFRAVVTSAEHCILLKRPNQPCLVISTAKLRLELAAPTDVTPGDLARSEDGAFAAAWAPPPDALIDGSVSLRVRLLLRDAPLSGGDKGPEWSEWFPGKPNPRQLPGTIRTLDKADGAAQLRCDALPLDMRSGQLNDAHCAMGVLSRDGWALLDDGATGRFDDSAEWPWAAPRDPESLAAERAAKRADGDPRCDEWARSGECSRNRDFMRASCGAACDRAKAREERARAEASGAAPRRVDWYLLAAGLDFKGALRDLSSLSGAQPVPPRFAFGIWYSRWWPYADWEAERLLREADEHGVPADVLITDMDWHHTCYRRTYGSEGEKSMDKSGNWPCWSGFSFDRKYFPHPESFLGWCKAVGVHNGFNLHFQSGLTKEGEDRWDAFAAALELPPTAEFRAFDPLNKTYSAAFHEHVLAPLERLGIDFWWLDWQQGEGLFAGSDMPEANPTWWLNYVYATQPDGRAGHAGHGDRAAHRRRLIMHRWGGLGNQRYPIGFSGDVTSSWSSLAFQPAFTAAAANLNFGYWSHDIGGFYEPVEPELYVRWVQFGALSPIFRAHGFRATNIEKRFWLFGDQYFVAMRAALRLRIELLPHLYTAARAAHDGGPSPVRPLYHEWPLLDEAFDFDGEYVFGPNRTLVVAPITKRSDADAPLARGVRLWVPPGRWVLVPKGLAFDGPMRLADAFALDEIPMLAASNEWIFGRVPPDAEWGHCAAGSRGWLGRAQELPRCPQASIWLSNWEGADAATLSGVNSLYEDDGWSDRYKDGASGGATAWTELSWRLGSAAAASSGGKGGDEYELRITIGGASGCLFSMDAAAEGALVEPGQPEIGAGVARSWRLLLHGAPPPRTVHVVGRTQLRFADAPMVERLRRADTRTEDVWYWDAERLCVGVWVFDVAALDGTELILRFPREAARLAARTLQPTVTASVGALRTAALGAVQRAKLAKGLLDATYPDTQPQDYDQTTWLAGLGTRLASLPANFSKEMTAFPGVLDRAREQLNGGEPPKRATGANVERVRNATALLAEAGVPADAGLS